MVDAVNAVNSVTNTRIRMMQDLSKDWRMMSANEILEHAGKGEDVPLEVLQWAEDYSKMTNVPDDVTYDAVNGETNADKVQENLGATDADNASEAAEEAEESEDSGATDEEPDLYTQAGILIPESYAASSSVDDMNADVNSKINESEKIAESATQKAAQTENNITSTRAEYDELLNRMQGDKSKINSTDLAKLDKLSNILLRVGSRAQSELSVYDIQIQEIEKVFSQYEPVPPAAIEKGTETIDVGTKLIEQSPQSADEIDTPTIKNTDNLISKIALQQAHEYNWKFLFDRNYAMGVRAVEAGVTATDSGDEGTNVLANGQAVAETSSSTVRNAIDKVEDLTFAQGNNIDTNQSGDNSQSDDNRRRQNRSVQTDRTGDKNIDNANVQANDLELKRRKELRGEYDVT
jgi:hypothetical protein